LIVSLVAGAAAGVLYFGGLWWTVRRLPRSRQPHVLAFASFALRLTAVVGAVVALAFWHWLCALGAMAGLLVARTVMVHRLGPARTAGGPENQ
jgi:F1F0 ATPase subunit 2